MLRCFCVLKFMRLVIDVCVTVVESIVSPSEWSTQWKPESPNWTIQKRGKLRNFNLPHHRFSDSCSKPDLPRVHLLLRHSGWKGWMSLYLQRIVLFASYHLFLFFQNSSLYFFHSYDYVVVPAAWIVGRIKSGLDERCGRYTVNAFIPCIM